MRRRTRLSAFLFVSGSILALTLFARSVAHAQVDTGAILGTVKDQTGAVVPGVKVTATNEGTSLSAIAATGSDGSYVFTPIRIGSYKLTAEFKGFQTVTRPHVSVDVQQQVVVDFTLVPGQVTETVEVTAAPALLETQNASVGQVVGSREVNDLPLNGRNYTFLAQLTSLRYNRRVEDLRTTDNSRLTERCRR
ncbi:MAG: hypothetical protein DMG24_20550 [Acidobacteria bacterium]|nr:MAG: hypothetical protein DMG24_20550 [Acidobacteriota bacterium]